MDLLVGCPVWRREWVLRDWFDHVERSCAEAELVPGYVFTVDRRDGDSRRVIDEHCTSMQRELHVVVTDEDQDQFREDNRDWSQPRIHHMVWVRNKLLGRVRDLRPDLFLSLDSDILLAPGALTEMLEDIPKFDAVGGKCFMTPNGHLYPSYGMLVNAGSMIRDDHVGVIPVDVIMAIKLMVRAAYSVDYVHNAIGEDIGWSSRCSSMGLHLGWDGRTCSKHVMSPDDLHKVDARCGY